jgi:hypothetical protein
MMAFSLMFNELGRTGRLVACSVTKSRYSGLIISLFRNCAAKVRKNEVSGI